MSEKLLFKAPCPKCQGDCNAFVHGEKSTKWEDDSDLHNYMYGGTSHKLLECCGCSTVFYFTDSWHSEECDFDDNGQVYFIHSIKTFPSRNLRPSWLDSLVRKDYVLYHILCEVYKAVGNESYILATIGLRTAFDRAIEIIGIDTALSMKQKVDAVFKEGFVGETEHSQLDIVTEAGNAAAHRGWSPNSYEFTPLLHAMERFIEKSVMRDKSIEELKERIPMKQKKRK
ncbi:DUF4145 domain-containing protein [Raoultella ornithinolytica]|uniref:DUF4145 domain-containing protein n=1 Tax=Raoultella ornithinolytica TaxID=54291 RepID=UPI000E584146|nr:DUF4145 domain-containing protein [Raoultella ornithinolytica]HEC2579714.1 DUF4145 domain-containing protein [Raoultella ornithinolytica]HEC2585573.1 DUF4145 domain-containing protein [Raoultella ornithinolytica]HEC2621473.1 DUF4145 domain-containing protein [Raoultella ornithinolytica]